MGYRTENVKFLGQKPKNRDFDPVVPNSARVNIKKFELLYSQTPTKKFGGIRGDDLSGSLPLSTHNFGSSWNFYIL